MTDSELRELRAQQITLKMCKQMDGFIENADAPSEIVDILIAWSQVLGAVIGTIPGANMKDYDKVMTRCNENAKAAFLVEMASRLDKD